jgi:hypothetical protein
LLDILKGDSSNSKPKEELNNIYTKVLKNLIRSSLRQYEKDIVYGMLRKALRAIVTLFLPLPAYSLA